MESSGIDRSYFAGKDFVTKADVLAVLQPFASSAAMPVAGTATMPAANSAAMAASGGAVPAARAGSLPVARAVLPVDPAKAIASRLSSGKKREIEYLGEVQSTGLTSTIHSYVGSEGLFTHINRSQQYLKDSILPVMIYEASRLLSDYPLLNAYFTGEQVAVYKDVNIGFAIDIDKGLKVLKIDGAARHNVREIEGMIIDLSGRYLDDTLQLDDLTDITFTITDLSSEGVAFFRPLINKMNSSILGVSSIEKMQRFMLSLTFDHRVTEGKLAARFLKDLKERLESYRSADHLRSQRDIICFKCFKTLKEDLSGTGFARCITPEGKEGYICQSCLKGF
jgi:pyruvate/2-oxoglutarate dehydrogenase complex dihydrolipoamide acyltransferase (E2) component